MCETPLNNRPASQLIIVPQRPYLARTTHLSQPLLPPIEFHINGQRGVRLSDALAGNVDGLDDPETAILGAVGMKVTYRLEFPGYRSFGVQKYARDSTRQSDPHSRRKIVKQIAQVVCAFIRQNANRIIDPEFEPWRVGLGFLQVDRLFLMGLVQVSHRSFQPVLGVEYSPHEAS